MSFPELAGGVTLTIFGVRFFRKGLDRLFGSKLVGWLSHLTENRWKAFSSGIFIGMLAPSSTALALITLQMLNAGRFTAERMLAVLLGANLGITVTVQFLAFHIQDYAGIFICCGVVMFQFMKREVLRGIGQCVLSLGFIFLAMRLIGQAALELRGSVETAAWLQLLEGHPVLVLAFVALTTVCVQSSTASVGIALAFADGGLLTPALIIPWVAGANIGISLTALAAGWTSLEGRRLGLANVLVKALVAFPFLYLPELDSFLFSLVPHSLPREIALFHTGFNLLVGILVLPFTGIVTKAVRWLVIPHSPTDELSAIPTYLDTQALETPSLALANATRETLQMADRIKIMLDHFWKGYSERNSSLTRRIQQEDDIVDDSYRRIRNYLNDLRDGMTEEESRWQFDLLTFSTELEAVGDVIDKNLCDATRKMLQENAVLSPEDEAVLEELNEKVLRRFDVAVSLLTTRDGRQARTFLAGKESFNDWCRQVQKAHYERLRNAGADAIAASAHFLEMVNSFRRINSHISAIGYAFSIPASPSGTRTRKATTQESPSPVSVPLSESAGGQFSS